jgi:hypothetical protein
LNRKVLKLIQLIKFNNTIKNTLYTFIYIYIYIYIYIIQTITNEYTNALHAHTQYFRCMVNSQVHGTFIDGNSHVAFCVPTHLFFFFLFLYHSTTHIKMLFGNMIAGLTCSFLCTYSSFFFFLFLYHSTTHIKMLFGNMIAGEVHPQPHISAFDKEKKSDF